MKVTVTTLVLCALLAACGSPPKPVKCIGEFQPINGVIYGTVAPDTQSVANLCNSGGAHGYQG